MVSHLKQINLVKKQDNLLSKLLILRSRVSENKISQINLDELKQGGVVKLREKDMFSVWVRAVCNNMDSIKLKRVALIAEKYAKGFILFSTRQIPIIPLVHIDNVMLVKKELEELNMLLDRCGSRVRNADVCYDKNICAEAVLNPISLGEKIDKFWKNDKGGFKIKISISGCKKECIYSKVLSDLGFIGIDKNNKKGYDAFIGGRLGLNPNIGIKVADCLSENQCVNLIQNYFDLIKEKGMEGERSADLVKRLGIENLRLELNKNLNKEIGAESFKCETSINEKNKGIILRIKANCGIVYSNQLMKIAEIAEKYGKSFVHFSIYGSPEIPYIQNESINEIKKELAKVNMEILDKGIDNLQSCFGDYCSNGIVDPHGVLFKIDKLVNKLKLNNPEIRISASGCPNSCGVSHISDIGFLGVIDVEIDSAKCNGCAICLKSCKKLAIHMKDNKAIIDKNKCAFCGECMRVCPFDSIKELKRGFAVLVGGKGGEYTRLGETIAEFLNEDEALQLTGKILKSLKKKKVESSTTAGTKKKWSDASD